MPKKSKSADASTVETPEVFGGIQETTPGKREEDPPIVLTRSDPSFEAREKLAEKLWEEEKENFHVACGPDEGKPAEEVLGDTEDAETPADSETEEEVEAKPAEDQGIEGDGAEADEGTEDEEEYETLVVDGVETKKTAKEVYEAGKRALQKDMSADKRLEEATALLNEVKAGVMPQLSDQDVAARRQLQPVPNQEQQARIKALYEQLRYGDDEEGEQALREVLGGRESATPQMEQIFYGVGLMLEQEKIRTAFVSDPGAGGYSDILPKENGGKCEDPEVWGFFDYKVNQLIQQGEPNALPTYQKAAETVRSRFSTQGRQAGLSEKRDKKRGIDVVKGVKAKTPATPEEKEETHEDILNWHRRNRA